MKTPARMFSCGSLALLLAAFGPFASAALPVISPGERVVFSEDFPTNAQNWTQVAVVNGAGTAETGKATLAKSAWGPSLSDGKAVSSAHVFKTPLKISSEPVAVALYMSVRIDNPDGIETNRFNIMLTEAAVAQPHFIRLEIRPSLAGSMSYRNRAGAVEFVRLESTRDFFRAPDQYRQFKLILRAPKGLKGEVTAEAFYYDPKAAKYVSFGTIPAGVIDLRSGVFDRVLIESRNGDGGAAWFDSVVVTQGRP